MGRFTQYGLETIDPQHNHSLFDALTAEFRLVNRRQRIKKEDGQRLVERLTSLTFKKTGMNVSYRLVGGYDINASVMWPLIDRNHPLMKETLRELEEPPTTIGSLKRKKETLEAAVDIKRSRVSGLFSKFPIQIQFFTTLLIREILTAEEAAAIVLHELGHIFTYFEYFGKTISTNFVLDYVARELVQTHDPVIGYRLIKEACETLDITINDPKAILASTNPSTIYTIFLQATAAQRVVELNSKHYDRSAAEMLADQFASRHGAGYHLVVALNKIDRYYDPVVFYSPSYFLFTSTMAWLAGIVMIPVFMPLVFGFLFFQHSTKERRYDDSKARYERIRRDLIAQLKDRTLDRAIYQEIVENIKGIDEILETIYHHRDLVEVLVDSTIRRREMNQLEFQQRLEQFVHNDLFYHATRLKIAS
jgi:hypothetical protein